MHSSLMQATLFGNDVRNLFFQYNVEGTQSQTQSSSGSSSSRLAFTQPSGRNLLIAHSSKRSSKASVSIKVVQAKLKRTRSGKPEFTTLNVVYIDVTDSTANVNYVRNAVQNKWGSDHLIVSAEGLPIEDSSGTQGDN